MSFSERHKLGLWDALWENAIGGLAILSRDGTFERANPAFCEIVEYSEYELQSMKFQDITHPSDIDADTELAKQILVGQRSTYDMVKSYVTKTRRIVWVHLRVISFEVDGTFHYFLSQVFEIPVSVVNQVSPDTLKLAPPPYTFPWKAFKEWTPWVVFIISMALAGIAIIVPIFTGITLPMQSPIP